MRELQCANYHCNLMRLSDLMQYSLPKYLSQLGTTLPPSGSLHPDDKVIMLDGQMDKMINCNPAHTSLLTTAGIF